MSCNCQQTSTPCNPCSQTTPCTEPNCACPVIISSDCVNNVTEDLTCSNIVKGQTLTEVLVQLDAFICEKFGSLANFFTIINVGSGIDIYKGDTLTGKKQLRTLVDSSLINIEVGNATQAVTLTGTIGTANIVVNGVNYLATYTAGSLSVTAANFVTAHAAAIFAATGTTVTSSGATLTFSDLAEGFPIITVANVIPNLSATIQEVAGGSEIIISVDETAMDAFIEANQLTYSTANIGSGAGVWKNNTVVLDNTQFNLKSLSTSSVGAGASIIKDTDTTTDVNKIDFRFKSLSTSSTGVGIPVVKDIDTTTDVNKVDLRFKTLKSTNNSVVIDGFTDDIDLRIQPMNVGIGVGVFKDINPDEINFKTFKSTDNSIVITGETNEINLVAANLQRVLTIAASGTYTIQQTDNNYSIIVDNLGAATIYVPNTGLMPEFQVGFIQKGAGDITFAPAPGGLGTGITIQNPIGLLSKGQYYHTFLEREGALGTWYLLGNTKA